MNRFRLTQCHHCFSYDGHIRPFCPYRGEDKICNKCGESGHSPVTCINDLKCINCSGRHPANSKQCPVYKSSLAEAQNELVRELQSGLQINNVLDSQDKSKEGAGFTQLREVALSSLTPYDFLTELFHKLRNSPSCLEKDQNISEVFEEVDTHLQAFNKSIYASSVPIKEQSADEQLKSLYVSNPPTPPATPDDNCFKPKLPNKLQLKSVILKSPAQKSKKVNFTTSMFCKELKEKSDYKKEAKKMYPMHTAYKLNSKSSHKNCTRYLPNPKQLDKITTDISSTMKLNSKIPISDNDGPPNITT